MFNRISTIKMSLKRTLRSVKPIKTSNNNIKRERLLTQEEKQSVSEWLTRTETQCTNAVKTVTLQQPTAKGVLLLNCTEKSDKTSNRVLNLTLNLTEKKIYARFQGQRQAGIIMTPDEICECARTIHNELLQTQAEQLQLTKGRVLDVIDSKFDASEKWFQQFCERYNVPWRPHVETNVNLIQEPMNSAKLVPESSTNITVTKKPSPSRPISIIKLNHNKNNVTAANSNSIGRKKVIANTETIAQPTLECKKEARQFIRDFHEFITEGGYLPSQVFNAAEMFLNWKLLPECAKMYKIDRYNSGSDRLSLLFCGNASGDFLVKPMYLHHTWLPKNQDESLLPVYVPENLPNTHREFIRAEYFFEWLQNCFIPEVRDFLQAMNLPAKALLLIDAALLQGHSELPVSAEDNFVEFLYFPEKTASLLQPISMTVMPTFACNYLRRLFSFMMAYNVVNYSRRINSVWAQFTMTESLLLIQQSIEEINATCWNSGWTTIWKEIVHQPFDQNLITAAIKRIAAIGRQTPYAGLKRMTSEDIEKHLKTNPSLLPAFRVLSAGKNHLNWLDSDNDSELDETDTDLDKNPFLLKNNILDSDEVDEDEELNFESITVECNSQQENKYNSELNSPTPTASSRLLSISDCETPPTPEFDLSMCKSELSSPTPSENNIQDIDSDCSSTIPTNPNLQLNECRMELAAFKNEVKSSVVNKIDNISQALKNIPEKSDGAQAIRSLHEKLDLVVNELSILKSQCAKIEKKAGMSKTLSQTETLIEQPFETAAEFLEFDVQLHTHNKLQEQLTRFFHSKLSNETNLDKGIEQIWRTFLTDDAACEFVWKRLRTSDRCPVKDFKFSELLKSFFMENVKGNVSAFDAICARSFTAAHDRWRKQQRYRILQKKR